MRINQQGRIFDLQPPRGFKFTYVWGKGVALFSDRKFKKSEKVISLKGRLVSERKATPEAVQMTKTQFIDTARLVPEDFVSHSCSPNTKLDTKARWFIALQDIPKNAEITFNYLTTEYDMEKLGTAFMCICGSKKCYRRIRGFKYLNRKQQEQLKPLLSPYLQTLI